MKTDNLSVKQKIEHLLKVGEIKFVNTPVTDFEEKRILKIWDEYKSKTTPVTKVKKGKSND